MQLLKQGRTVVAAVRDAERASAAFGKMGITEGVQEGGSGILFIDAGVNITDADTLTPELFKGVTQVVSSVGAVFGRSADGTMGCVLAFFMSLSHQLNGVPPGCMHSPWAWARAWLRQACMMCRQGSPCRLPEATATVLPLAPRWKVGSVVNSMPLPHLHLTQVPG